MNDLSKRLRHAAAIGGSNADNDSYYLAPVTIKDIKEAADLIDQQAAEIADLKRQAARLFVLATKWAPTNHHDWREITEAAQWFEEE